MALGLARTERHDTLACRWKRDGGGVRAAVPLGQSCRSWAAVGPGWGCRRVTEPVTDFAGLLRQLREQALLTQEELAEAAGLSPRSVSDLERGIHRTARKDTAVLLAGALGLDGP